MHNMNAKNLKEQLKNNVLTIGSWINLAHPAIAEIMADAGFEWLVVDMEHSVITIREAEELIRIIDLKGVTPLVRLTSNDPDQIKRVMDAGAHGVIVPMVNTPEQAEAAVRAVKYPPIGSRGVGLARAQKYGFGFEEYKNQQQNSIVIAQIEHIDSIDNLEKIINVEGLDGTMIGPYDLSGSMGKPGQFEDEDVKTVLELYESIIKKNNKSMGYHVIKPDSNLVHEKMTKGYTFIAFSVDFLFLGTLCREQMGKLNQYRQGLSHQ